MRVHRSYMINKTKIKEIHKYFKGTYLFIMTDFREMKIKTANSYSSKIKQLLLIP